MNLVTAEVCDPLASGDDMELSCRPGERPGIGCLGAESAPLNLMTAEVCESGDGMELSCRPGERPAAGDTAMEGSCRAADVVPARGTSPAMPQFDRLSPVANMFRLGKVVQADASGMDRTVRSEDMPWKDKPAPKAPEKRRERCAALDSVPARDAFAVVATAVMDEYLSHADWTPNPAAVRADAVRVWRELTGGGERGVELADVADAVVALTDAVQPVTTPISPTRLAHQLCERGHRPYMEDFGVVYTSDYQPGYVFADPLAAECPPPEHGDTYAAVFDGHAGVEAAEWARARLHHHIFSHPEYRGGGRDGVRKVLLDSFAAVDGRFAEWAEEHGVDSGSCVVTAVHRPEQRELWTAWVGDCGACLCRGKSDDEFECVQLSRPHVVSDREEEDAVIARGGQLLFGGGRLRVEGALQITRSIGDRPYRAALSQRPEVRCTELSDSDEFVVVASDGLFDAMKPEDVLEFVRQSKMAVDEWADHQRTLLRKWAESGRSTSHTVEDDDIAASPKSSTMRPGTMSPMQRSVHSAGRASMCSGSGRRWSSGGWPCDGFDDDEHVELPTHLRTAYGSLRSLVDKQQELREGVESLVGCDEPQPALLDELLEMAFSGSLRSSLSYQVIVNALLAEAFTQKRQGRDNTSVIVVFLCSKLLSSEDLETSRRLRTCMRQ